MEDERAKAIAMLLRVVMAVWVYRDILTAVTRCCRVLGEKSGLALLQGSSRFPSALLR
jgi:hypothetical protein